MTAGRRMAVLKLDFSPLFPSKQACGNSGEAKVCQAWRGKETVGGKSYQEAVRKEENRFRLLFFIIFFSSGLILFFILSFLSNHFPVWLKQSQHAYCFPPPSSLLLHLLLLFPPANKKWRLMNSALMHASATVIALALGTPPTVTKCVHHQDGGWM